MNRVVGKRQFKSSFQSLVEPPWEWLLLTFTEQRDELG